MANIKCGITKTSLARDRSCFESSRLAHKTYHIRLSLDILSIAFGIDGGELLELDCCYLNKNDNVKRRKKLKVYAFNPKFTVSA